MIFFFEFIPVIVLNLGFYIFYKKIGKLVNIYDFPDNQRKTHIEATPLIGGIQLLLNIILIPFLKLNPILENFEFLIINLSIFSALIFIIGIIDDKINLNANYKLISLLLVVWLAIFFNDDLKIQSLYFETIDYSFRLGKYSFFFTLLCFLLFINACNMFDGSNLQLGLYSLQIFSFLLFNGVFYQLSIILIIFLIFFNLLNKSGKIFFGDSGSYQIGFIISFIIVIFYNNFPNSLSVEKIFILMCLPGIDMFRLFIYRILNRKHPFKPDNKHIHHLLQKKYNKTNSNLIIQLFIFSTYLLSEYFNILFVITYILILYTFTIIKFSK